MLTISCNCTQFDVARHAGALHFSASMFSTRRALRETWRELYGDHYTSKQM